MLVNDIFKGHSSGKTNHFFKNLRNFPSFFSTKHYMIHIYMLLNNCKIISYYGTSFYIKLRYMR